MVYWGAPLWYTGELLYSIFDMKCSLKFDMDEVFVCTCSYL